MHPKHWPIKDASALAFHVMQALIIDRRERFPGSLAPTELPKVPMPRVMDKALKAAIAARSMQTRSNRAAKNQYNTVIYPNLLQTDLAGKTIDEIQAILEERMAQAKSR